MATTKEKMQQARELIKSGNHEGARAILETVDHPLAMDWLLKLPVKKSGKGKLKVEMAEVEDQLKSREGQQRSATIVFIFSLLLSPVGVGIVLLPFSLINYFRHKRAVKRLQIRRRELLAELED